MKLREFIKQDIDIDVVDNVCESLYIAFCGPCVLTKEGEERYAEVLDYEINIRGEFAIIEVDDPDEKVWKHKLHKAKQFFYDYAGYCPWKDYKKWFVDEFDGEEDEEEE